MRVKLLDKIYPFKTFFKIIPICDFNPYFTVSVLAVSCGLGLFPGPILLSKLNYVQNQLLSGHPRELQANHINLNIQNYSRTIFKHLTGNITN